MIYQSISRAQRRSEEWITSKMAAKKFSFFTITV